MKGILWYRAYYWFRSWWVLLGILIGFIIGLFLFPLIIG